MTILARSAVDPGGSFGKSNLPLADSRERLDGDGKEGMNQDLDATTLVERAACGWRLQGEKGDARIPTARHLGSNGRVRNEAGCQDAPLLVANC
jgi:hypothetical protein